MLEGYMGFRGKKQGPCHYCHQNNSLLNGYCKRCRTVFRLGTPEHALQNIVKQQEETEKTKEIKVKKIKKKQTKNKKNE